MLDAAWQLKDARRNERARNELERALAFVRQRELNIYVEYLLATRAPIDLAMGHWDAAVAAADALVSQARLANAVARIPALEVTGLVALRRGQPGARGHLDAAWELARATGGSAWTPRRRVGAGPRDGRDSSRELHHGLYV